MVGCNDRCRQGHVVGLTANAEDRSETSIDVVEDGRPRPEIRGDLENIVRPQTFDGSACLGVRADIGAAEPVDRLFRITNDEQGSRTQAHVLPSLGRLRAGDPKENLGLKRIGILEFINEDVPVPFALGAARTASWPRTRLPARSSRSSKSSTAAARLNAA